MTKKTNVNIGFLFISLFFIICIVSTIFLTINLIRNPKFEIKCLEVGFVLMDNERNVCVLQDDLEAFYCGEAEDE